MLKIEQNRGKIANYPPNAQQRFAPLGVARIFDCGANRKSHAMMSSEIFERREFNGTKMP